MNEVSRRMFLSGGIAAFGGLVFPGDVFAALGKPLMSFGVISDVHVGGPRPTVCKLLENALRYLDSKGVDAVLFAGDIAHSGRIGQMEKFAATWHKVFPNNCGRDGRKVELMLVTGNHDAWTMGWPKQSEEKKLKEWLIYRDNPRKTWKRLFNQEWEPVWRKEVKGITFIGSQWPSLGSDIEKYMKENGKSIDASKPFFYCQHEHPKGTCHGSYADCTDRGESVRAFSAFPNSVVISGHSHCSLADERAIWQGAFTAVGAGCLHEAQVSFDHANGSAFWHPSIKKHLMAPMNDPYKCGGDPDGGCFELIEVYADSLVVHRRSSVYDLPIGSAWQIPIPSKCGGKYDFAKQRQVRQAPQFAQDAMAMAERCPSGHRLAVGSRRKESCIAVSFPPAKAVDGCRVFTYEIITKVDGKQVRKEGLFAAGFSVPPEKSERGETYLVAEKDLPKGGKLSFEITPIESFGNRGKTLKVEI